MEQTTFLDEFPIWGDSSIIRHSKTKRRINYLQRKYNFDERSPYNGRIWGWKIMATKSRKARIAAGAEASGKKSKKGKKK